MDKQTKAELIKEVAHLKRQLNSITKKHQMTYDAYLQKGKEVIDCLKKHNDLMETISVQNEAYNHLSNMNKGVASMFYSATLELNLLKQKSNPIAYFINRAKRFLKLN